MGEGNGFRASTVSSTFSPYFFVFSLLLPFTPLYSSHYVQFLYIVMAYFYFSYFFILFFILVLSYFYPRDGIKNPLNSVEYLGQATIYNYSSPRLEQPMLGLVWFWVFFLKEFAFSWKISYIISERVKQA